MALELRSGIILFAHGSRDPAWREPFLRLRELLQARAPHTPVALAFLDFIHPTLSEAMAVLADAGVTRITLVPLFMAQGGHLRTDLPLAVQRACEAHPGLQVRTTSAIGDVDVLLRAIADWVLLEEAHTRAADLEPPVA